MITHSGFVTTSTTFHIEAVNWSTVLNMGYSCSNALKLRIKFQFLLYHAQKVKELQFPAKKKPQNWTSSTLLKNCFHFANNIKQETFLKQLTINSHNKVMVITSVFSSSELKRCRTEVFLSRTPNGLSAFPCSTTELSVGCRVENLVCGFIACSARTRENVTGNNN